MILEAARAARVLAWALCAAALWGCGGGPGPDSAGMNAADEGDLGASGPPGRERVVTEDRNRDGRPDRWLHYRGRVVVMKESDLNYDGRPDVRAEFSSVTEKLRAVAVVSEARDSNFDGRYDRWEVYEDGRRVSSSEDRSGDGRPDYEERYARSGRLTAVGLDRSGDGQVDMVRHLDERGEPRTVRYDEDSDGRFETEVEREGGRPVKITSGGREVKPGDLLHTKGLDSRVAGVARGAQGEMLLSVELRNSGAEKLAIAARPSSVEFRLKSATSAGRTFTISSDVPKASEQRLVLEPGESRTLAFPVDFKPPEGAYKLRATLNYGWDESAPTGWMGSSVAEEIDFNGKVGAVR